MTSSLDLYMLQGGNGYVRGVRFENVRMDNVDNPIIIDQLYCDSPKSCQKQVRIPFFVLDSYLTIYSLITILVIWSEFCSFFQTSAVRISEIMYRNISGTTKSAKAMKFSCSDTAPCSTIVLSNVNLEKEDGTVETYCNSAEGFGYGVVHPSADCLTSHDKDYSFFDQTEVSQDYILNDVTEEKVELADSNNDRIVHTELWHGLLL